MKLIFDCLLKVEFNSHAPIHYVCYSIPLIHCHSNTYIRSYNRVIFLLKYFKTFQSKNFNSTQMHNLGNTYFISSSKWVSGLLYDRKIYFERNENVNYNNCITTSKALSSVCKNGLYYVPIIPSLHSFNI